jgi:hypothetical protein
MPGRLLLILSFLLMLAPLSAQESASLETFSFQTETARLRELISSPETAPRQRHNLLVELAELLRLSGDNEGAATVWKDAAVAVPGERDDRAVLERAACLMAIGEWDEAAAAVRLVLLTSRNAPGIILRAKYLAAQIEAFTRGDTVALEFYLDDPDYASLKPSIYYTLYIIARDETYKNRLITEYPASPETRLLTDDTIPFPGAMWLLYPGRESITIQQ